MNRIVVDSLIRAGESAVSIHPSSSIISENGRIVEWFTKPLETLLEFDMLPVVYGDIGLDLEKGCCILSTEEVFRFLARKLGASKVIMCGKTDGVFTGDPNKQALVEHIPEITQENLHAIREHLGASDGIDVTGGMLHKIEQALEYARDGAIVQIINGSRPGVLKESLLGKTVTGTIIR